MNFSKKLFYIIAVDVDDNGNPIQGTETAVSLLTDPLAIYDAQEILKAKDHCPPFELMN